MSGLIDDVLDFARGRLGGGLNIDRRVDDGLRQKIEAVVTELRTSMPDRKIVSHFNIDGEVECDSARIAQTVSNLVANALTPGVGT